MPRKQIGLGTVVRFQSKAWQTGGAWLLRMTEERKKRWLTMGHCVRAIKTWYGKQEIWTYPGIGLPK